MSRRLNKSFSSVATRPPGSGGRLISRGNEDYEIIKDLVITIERLFRDDICDGKWIFEGGNVRGYAHMIRVWQTIEELKRKL